MPDHVLSVQMSSEHIDRNAIVSPKEAIKELIWNSCDADATSINISFETNTYFDDNNPAIEEITVKDNGHGIKYEDLSTLLGYYGRSDKTYSRKSPKGRLYHGKQGHGRYKSFSIGAFVKWESVYIADDGHKYRFFLDFNSESKTDCSYSEKELVADTETTGISVTISGIMDNVSVLSDRNKMEEEIVSSFAPYLLAYKDIEIIYDAYKINPESYIQDNREVQIEFENAGTMREATVNLISWKSAQGKSLYICGGGGVTYDTLPIITKNHAISVYVLSDFFDEMQQDNRLAFGMADPYYDSFVTQAKTILRDYINEQFQTDAVEEVRSIKDTDIYPYSGEVVSEVDNVERQYFDLLAVEINSIIPKFRNSAKDTKRLTYRLIKEAVRTKSTSITSILTEVFKLTTEEQDRLAVLLEHTSLPSIINTAQTISDRLLFIHALEQMVYNNDIGKSIRERTQFHKILLGELWVFGEKYALGASDISLKNILIKYLQHLGRDELSPSIPGDAASNITLIPDLCLWNQYPIQDEWLENLVVELKRPTKTLGKVELDQIEKYAFAIIEDEQFPKENTKWNFTLVGRDFDNYVTRKLQDRKDGAGNFYNSEDGTVSISILKWSKIIQENKLRFNFLKKQLDYSLEDSQQALDFLHTRYADLFSE